MYDIELVAQTVQVSLQIWRSANLAAQYILEPVPTLALFSAILCLWW
jgi:hypothetical protein